jgi:phosphoribosylglycinamide formyltransferase-1
MGVLSNKTAVFFMFAHHTPAMAPGLDAQKQTFEHGVKISGCTVHFVDPQLDAGPIILQAAVPVLENDTPDSLSARILAEEHRIYSEAIAIVLAGHSRIEGRRVVVD